MRIEKGFGFIKVSKLEDGRHKVIQIKKDFLDKYAGVFEAEEGPFQQEVQTELNDVFDFSISFLADVLDDKNHKSEIITTEELNERFLGK